jgi:SAM-dependent methyltransferase
MMQAAPSDRFRQPADVADARHAHDGVEAYYHEIASFYEAEQAGRDDLDFWRRVAADHRGGRVLDLGAGSGRVTEVLADAAGEVVAVDLSPDLLSQARVRLAAYPHVRLLRADMRALAFRAPFDAIVAANDPFSHLLDAADRDRALQLVARHLAPSGRFVLDALWLPPSEAYAVASPDGRISTRTADLDGQPLRIVERWRRTSSRRHSCAARYEYRRAGLPSVTAEFEARDWSPRELAERFRRAGLTIEHAWGSYDGVPWRPDRSTQLIVAATLA